ncbi:hypothetical protein [Magnetospirillum molischianum]|uniref:Uncharacterized protein n=1 Tax=Magnetospirillum molischianum DSM 120 TaxID=1150626 RepID=H8FSU4_MAGML|nr:hypothetical protein [Magnetospirillum molischianum]CCG41432.1 exported hypothetical protein [Magnetospirillum molischianum DSM 120]
MAATFAKILFSRTFSAPVSGIGTNAVACDGRSRPPVLICPWTLDPASGRLVCAWKSGTDPS